MFIDSDHFSIDQTQSPYATEMWRFRRDGQSLAIRFLYDDGMWGNHHFRFITPGNEEGGHLVGVHQLQPNRYTPVHVLPKGNGDIVFATIAGYGLLLAHADSLNKDFRIFQLNKHAPLIKLEGPNIMYCLFSSEKNLEVAYITTPSHGPHREEIISPGGVGEPESFWDEIDRELLKRIRKT